MNVVISVVRILRLSTAAAVVVLAASAAGLAEDVLNVTDPAAGFADWKVREFKGKASFHNKAFPRPGLMLESRGTSFALAKEMRFVLAQWPFINFEWVAEKLPEGGDVRQKHTDDQAAQVYVIVPSFPELVNYKAVGYVWDSIAPHGVYPSQKTGNVKYVVLRSGKQLLGAWQSEKRNVYEDFKTLWGMDLAKEKKIVVSVNIDSDDTKSSAQSSYGLIFFSRK